MGRKEAWETLAGIQNKQINQILKRGQQIYGYTYDVCF